MPQEGGGPGALEQCFSNFERAQITRRSCYNADSPSVDPRWRWSVCASNKFPDEADTAGPWIRVPKVRPRTLGPKMQNLWGRGGIERHV